MGGVSARDAVRVVLVAGIARDRTIGRDGGLPWHYTEDLKHFKRLTTGAVVLMGTRTMESVRRPLPGRTTLVLTRKPREAEARWMGVGGAATLDGAVSMTAALGHDNLFVAGGGVVYGLALPHADELLLTEIPEVGGGDVYFPEWDRADWREESRESLERVQIVRYLRKR